MTARQKWRLQKKENQDTIEDDKEIQPWKGQRNATKQQETKKTKKKNNHTGVVFLLVRPKSVRLHVNPFKKVSEFPKKVLATWSVGWAQTCAVGQLQDLARRVWHLVAAYQSLPRVTSREKTCWSSKFLNCPNLPVLVIVLVIVIVVIVFTWSHRPAAGFNQLACQWSPKQVWSLAAPPWFGAWSVFVFVCFYCS